MSHNRRTSRAIPHIPEGNATIRSSASRVVGVVCPLLLALGAIDLPLALGDHLRHEEVLEHVGDAGLLVAPAAVPPAGPASGSAGELEHGDPGQGGLGRRLAAGRLGLRRSRGRKGQGREARKQEPA